MVKKHIKERPPQISGPIFTRLDFPLVPVFILCLAFVLLLLTLSPYLMAYQQLPKAVTCGGAESKPCPSSLTCVLDGFYPNATGTCRQ